MNQSLFVVLFAGWLFVEWPLFLPIFDQLKVLASVERSSLFNWSVNDEEVIMFVILNPERSNNTELSPVPKATRMRRRWTRERTPPPPRRKLRRPEKIRTKKLLRRGICPLSCKSWMPWFGNFILDLSILFSLLCFPFFTVVLSAYNRWLSFYVRFSLTSVMFLVVIFFWFGREN